MLWKVIFSYTESEIYFINNTSDVYKLLQSYPSKSFNDNIWEEQVCFFLPENFWSMATKFNLQQRQTSQKRIGQD